MPSSEIPDELIREARAGLKDQQMFALIEIVEKASDYRGGIVSHWTIDRRRVVPLVRLGLVTRHTIPHVGHRATELGRAVVASVRP